MHWNLNYLDVGSRPSNLFVTSHDFFGKYDHLFTCWFHRIMGEQSKRFCKACFSLSIKTTTKSRLQLSHGTSTRKPLSHFLLFCYFFLPFAPSIGSSEKTVKSFSMIFYFYNCFIWWIFIITINLTS